MFIAPKEEVILYIYESHLGSELYSSDEELEWDQLYCEQCGDYDWLVGEVETRKEAYELLRGAYDEEYIAEFLNKCFEEKGG